MRRPNTSFGDGSSLPVVQATAVVLEDEADEQDHIHNSSYSQYETTEQLEAQLLGTDENASASTKTTTKGDAQHYSLSSGGEGPQQTYWGRFNDPHAEVLPTAPNEDSLHEDGNPIPTVTARLDDRQIRLRFIRKVYST